MPPGHLRKPPGLGGGLRARWKDDDGTIYEWDHQHGHVERYDPRGNHLGGYDAEDGRLVSEAVNTRRVKP
ncbi:colicin E3/pyocin S6 family cytotoxin [Methylobacterium sp.]|uniref:colicin E3/pyocin S6 family cytotoxin n=1 Tax=Methylobacterium sp. TaxID=409 RepID=UPI003457523B